jgi:hypothetical protein
MYQFITASKDASIYEQQPRQNTGLDEILEVSKVYYGSLKDTARSLIKFDLTSVSESVVRGDVSIENVDLILKECESNEIPIDYTIYAYAVSQSWDMGIGTRFDEVSVDGVTWNNRTTSAEWLPNSGSLSAEATASVLTGKGGVWYSQPACSQSFSYQSADIQMNVTPLITEWFGGRPNEGIMVKHSMQVERDTDDYGQLKFFSKETNTIYQPKLRIGWDDSSFTTGSLTELTSDDIHVTFKKLKTRYKVNSKPQIKVFGREKYPLKSYTNLYGYTNLQYLPATTYYQIKDVVTEDIIIPFSDYSKVSCDGNGNYFNLNLIGWETNREYYIEIKVDRDGVVEYFSDKDLTFTIEK